MQTKYSLCFSNTTALDLALLKAKILAMIKMVLMDFDSATSEMGTYGKDKTASHGETVSKLSLVQVIRIGS